MLQRYFAFSVALLNANLSTVDNTVIVSVRELNKELQYLKIDFEKGYPNYFKFWMKVSTFFFLLQKGILDSFNRSHTILQLVQTSQENN